MRFAPVFFSLLMLAGCASSTPKPKPKIIVVNGIEVYENYWNKTIAELLPRAKFDLNCAPDKITFSLFRKNIRTPSEVGAAGCGQRAVYIRAARAWILNNHAQ